MMHPNHQSRITNHESESRLPMCASKSPADFATAKEQGYYTIGRAAEITGVTAKMIRHYETLGLIPKANRTLGDYRVYSTTDLHALRFIRRARGLGFATKEIAGLLGLWRDQRRASAEVKRLALQHVAELDRKIEELQAMRATLASLAKHCHGDARPECPILDDLERLPSVEADSG
jgi:MerR family copper efflux transcriptional regulator